ncbi:hypothetical protein TeGR_g6209, partial [Tetraparma gracilis]
MPPPAPPGLTFAEAHARLLSTCPPAPAASLPSLPAASLPSLLHLLSPSLSFSLPAASPSLALPRLPPDAFALPYVVCPPILLVLRAAYTPSSPLSTAATCVLFVLASLLVLKSLALTSSFLLLRLSTLP